MPRPIYRVISTGKLVIKVGFDVKATPSESQLKAMFEFLDEDGEPTGKEKSFSWEELKEVRRD